MATDITSLVSKIQALLLDDGTAFSTATITAAVRQALEAYNQRAPIYKTETITAVAGQYLYSLASVDPLQEVLALLDTNNEYMQFQKWFEDGTTHNILLNQPVSEDFTLVYSIAHTIDGLDSESTTTLLADHENCLCNLAAGIAVVIRANGKVETVNLNADVPAQWMRLWLLWKQAFDWSLLNIQLKERMPVGKRLPGWDDNYHGWE
jgi:hypothetical protein